MLPESIAGVTTDAHGSSGLHEKTLVMLHHWKAMHKQCKTQHLIGASCSAAEFGQFSHWRDGQKRPFWLSGRPITQGLSSSLAIKINTQTRLPYCCVWSNLTGTEFTLPSWYIYTCLFMYLCFSLPVYLCVCLCMYLSMGVEVLGIPLQYTTSLPTCRRTEHRPP